jgi:hypothetical protein
MPNSPHDPTELFNLDTAPSVMVDLSGNTLPWIELAERLRRFIQLANANNLSSIDIRPTVRLLDMVLQYIGQYHQTVLQRLEQGLYRPSR